MPVVTARAFKKDKLIQLYILNRGPQTETVELVSSAKLAYPKTFEYVGGYLHVMDFERGFDPEHSRIEAKAAEGPRIEIPPFSLSRIGVSIP